MPNHDHTLTDRLRERLQTEYKYPPEIWKDPTVNFLGFGASSVDLHVAFIIDDVRLEHFKRRTRVTRELGLTIHRRFAEEGIEIPFPQTDVWLRDARE